MRFARRTVPGMPRMPRFFAPGLPLHVIQRGNDRATLFADSEDFGRFRGLLVHAAPRYGIAVHAYVLMTNHVHVLATPRSASSMPQAMHWIGCVFAQYLNTKYQRTGSRFEGRYRAAIVHDETYLLTCMRYIELNPVRAGIAASPAEYPWSSFRSNAHGEIDELIEPHPNFLGLGSAPRERHFAYRELFRGAVSDQDLHWIRRATQNGWAIGGDEFLQRISTQCRRAAPLRVRTARTRGSDT
jgi:putative transposase